MDTLGIHHAIPVFGEAAVAAVFARVAPYPGVFVELAPEPLRGGPARHCMVYEPGGIRVELVWAP